MWLVGMSDRRVLKVSISFVSFPCLRKNQMLSKLPRYPILSNNGNAAGGYQLRRFRNIRTAVTLFSDKAALVWSVEVCQYLDPSDGTVSQCKDTLDVYPLNRQMGGRVAEGVPQMTILCPPRQT